MSFAQFFSVDYPRVGEIQARKVKNLKSSEVN